MGRLRDLNIKSTSPYYRDFQRIRPLFLDYFDRTWISGAFPPQLWNMHNKVRGLTNNPQEGFNSKLNSLIQVKQPNADILVTQTARCLNDSEMRVWKLKVLFISFLVNLVISFNIFRLAVRREIGKAN